MNGSQPDHDPVIQESHQWVKHSHSMGSGDAQLDCDRPFLPYPKLEGYFDDRFRVQKLLRALFYDQAEPPVGPDEIRGDYCKVFFILLLIGRGRYIEHFVQHDDLCDQRLPFRTTPNYFPIAPTDSDFFNSFYKKQWEFCAPIFHDNMFKIFGDEEVLPIIHKEELRRGGSATTYKVVLHLAYDQLNRERNSAVLTNELHANTYVLKTYGTKEAEKYYTNEVSAFRELRRDGNDPNIIGYHGSFRQNGTYNVILEYADKGTLEDYFQTTSPPSRGEEIIKFWRGIFRILNALNVIHNVPRSVAHGPQFLQGYWLPFDRLKTKESDFSSWHQDVKPANILVKSSQGGSAFDCLFKLADLGLSHFTRTVSPTADATDKDTHGTQAYGAPECYRVNDLVDRQLMQVTPSVDIYSLGCVFSEAAIWVVRGRDGLEEYRRRRRMETRKIPNFRVSDCFHDGNVTLSTVHEMHDNLIQDCGRSDHVTGAAWNCMIKEMLDVEALRPNTRALYLKSERIITGAENELAKSAARRSSGGTHATRDFWSNLDDRARTPPQVPNGYHQYHPRTPPQRYGTIHDEHSPGPESLAYPKVKHGHPVYDFNPLTISKQSPPCGRNEDSVVMPYRGYNEAESEDDHQVSAAPSTPVSSENGYSRPSTSSSKSLPNTPLPAPKQRQPTLSVPEAQKWKLETKSRIKTSLPDDYLIKNLKQRDHVFLIDDSFSMKSHWQEVQALFGLLAYMVKDSDPDGIELYFTISSDSYRSKKTRELTKVLENKKYEGDSNIRLTLKNIVQRYKERLREPVNPATSSGRFRRRSTKVARDQNVYVFTDGIWQPDCDPTEIIADVVGDLKGQKVLKEQFGIQFVSFGSKPEGLARLKRLDSRLYLPLDIVDTEPSDGNVWKMLLGAVSAWFDDDHVSTINGTGSTPARPN